MSDTPEPSTTPAPVTPSPPVSIETLTANVEALEASCAAASAAVDVAKDNHDALAKQLGDARTALAAFVPPAVETPPIAN